MEAERLVDATASTMSTVSSVTALMLSTGSRCASTLARLAGRRQGQDAERPRIRSKPKATAEGDEVSPIAWSATL
jgi:hypothetical protein